MYIFINYAVPPELVAGNRSVSVPGNRYALLFTAGFKEATDNVECITIPPRQSKLSMAKNKPLLCGRDIVEGVKTHEILFRDMPIIKQFGIMLGVYNTVKKLVKQAQEPVVIITYNSNAWVSVPLMLLKKRYHYKSVIFLADMPFDENYASGIVKRAFRYVDNYIRVRSLKSYDACITAVECLKEEFFPDKPCTVIGPAIETQGYNEAFVEQQRVQPSRQTVDIVYTGSLNANYNIPNLIEAAHRLPEGYRMVFYGRGEFLARIQEEAEKTNGKIVYGGYLDSQSIKAVQVQADILITLLDTDKNISKYAVPSKVFDYMCAGVPIVSSDAKSVSEDIKEMLNITDDHSVDAIVNTILAITKDEDSLRKAKEKAATAREYAMNNFTWEVQKTKIIGCVKALEATAPRD